LDDVDPLDPRLFDPVRYAALPCKRRVAKLHAYIVRVGRVLRAPLEAVELGHDQGFGFFNNERSRMDEKCTELAGGWEVALGGIADLMYVAAPPQQLARFLRKRCSMATVAWVAVHDLVLPDFRRRGLASCAGYAKHVMLSGWRYFDVEPAEQILFMMRVINCQDVRLNRRRRGWIRGRRRGRLGRRERERERVMLLCL